LSDLALIGPDPGDPPALAHVHPKLLAQLADNLLDNAFKYTDPGTPVRLRVESSAATETVTVAVEDEGPGIARDDLPHVFQPFFRSPRTRGQGRPGVGLGLAVAGRIAASLGGSLTVQSAPGKGSTFALTLPRATVAEPTDFIDPDPAEPAID
jgi:signal transduction histidine kinase